MFPLDTTCSESCFPCPEVFLVLYDVAVSLTLPCRQYVTGTFTWFSCLTDVFSLGSWGKKKSFFLVFDATPCILWISLKISRRILHFMIFGIYSSDKMLRILITKKWMISFLNFLEGNGFNFYFFNDMEPHQGRAPCTHPYE